MPQPTQPNILPINFLSFMWYYRRFACKKRRQCDPSNYVAFLTVDDLKPYFIFFMPI